MTKKKGIKGNLNIKKNIELSEENYSVIEDDSENDLINESINIKIQSPNNCMETRGRTRSPKAFKKIAQNSATEVMQFLLSVVRNEEISTRDRILASKELLDRGFGKSLQEVQSNSNNTIRVILDTALKKLAE